MKTILLTGATGFLGSHLAEALLKNNFRVLCYHRPQSDFSRLQSVKNEIQWFNVDNGLDVPFKSVDTIDHVIHTATNYGRNREAGSTLVEANLVFPLRIVELAEFFNTATFFNTDTVLYKYLNSYALSKKQLCEWLKTFAKNTKVINIKLEHIYGPKDDNSKFIASIINQCQQNIKKINLTLGEQKRDFIYIDDAVDAYIKLLHCYDVYEGNYCDVELGSGHAVSIKHLVETIHKLTNSQSILAFGALPYRENEIMESVADCSALKKIGWLPHFDIERGILKTLEK